MPSSLRVGFAGTPPFAVAALTAIVEAGFDVPLVLTRPDQPQGRGLKLTPSAVRAAAAALGLTVVTPASLKAGNAVVEVTSIELDVLVVAAYGLILPQSVLAWPRYGCINIHASLLPRWRGAAPIQRALLAGDAETGITIMQMDAGLDTGPIIAVAPVSIAARETAGTLLGKLASAGARSIVDTLHRAQREGGVTADAQPDVGVTYAAKIGRLDAAVDWRADASALDRQVRALNPSPGAVTSIGGVLTKIWTAEEARGRFGSPGTVVRADGDAIVVACGDGALVVRELQRAGGRRMDAAAFLAGNPIEVDSQLDTSAH